MLIASFRWDADSLCFPCHCLSDQEGNRCYRESQIHKAILCGSLEADSPDVFALFVYRHHYQAALPSSKAIIQPGDECDAL